jgi:hypothetical protein
MTTKSSETISCSVPDQLVEKQLKAIKEESPSPKQTELPLIGLWKN